MKQKSKQKSADRIPVLPAFKDKKESFYESVYDLVRLIPRGRVSSYGAIASCLGTRSSARMVGWALGVSGASFPPVPAHRVVNRNGMLSGKHHFGAPTMMADLLKSEGVKVKKDTVVNFEKVFWDPAKELDLF